MAPVLDPDCWIRCQRVVLELVLFLKFLFKKYICARYFEIAKFLHNICFQEVYTISVPATRAKLRSLNLLVQLLYCFHSDKMYMINS